ncbi:MAG: glucose 1-dehydrogenase [Acidimicrobiia bacterium]|nr:glucose 1-dehydrogenase [Acidimicrobiia bacterium]MYG57764.1 glucose 1-dehydrogenase [Acidimicrobiia bacterium]MYJ33359.1 glucose 1-dehydrogenase [Acidimicrobiia bacterium]
MAVSAWSQPRVAIVTGGGSGIGEAVSQRLAADGAAVAVFDLVGDSAEETASAIRASEGTAIGVSCDVADRAAIEAGVAETVKQLGRPTILINNAGITPFGRFLDISREAFDQVIAVNLRGTFECCQVVIPHMVEEGWGRIVNISSSSAQIGNFGHTHYSASKAAVIGLTRSLAKEFGRKGITVNAVPPSFIETPSLHRAAEEGQLGSGIQEHIPTTPVRRVGQPEDIAAACAFLCRDDASYITGQVLGVNGGRVIV